MINKKLLASMVTVALTATTIVGCGGKGGNEAATSSGPDKEQYINSILQSEPKTLDPSKATDLYSSQVLSEIMEGLTRLEVDQKGNDVVKEAGAEKIEVSPDGLTWTFKLRDYKWSDGKPVTAKDFEYGIKRTLDPKTASQYAFLLAPIKNAEEFTQGKVAADAVGVKAKDDKTLEITLKGPCAYFKSLLHFKVFFPQRQDIVEKNAAKYGSETDTMVYCGPFKMKEWVHGNQVVLEKNNDYWDAKSVKLDKATFRIIKETDTVMNELDRGNLDIAPVNKPEWIKQFDQTGKFDVLKGYQPSLVYYTFNEKNKLFSNANIRKAFSVSMNREDIVKTLYKGIGDPAFAWSPPSLLLGNEDFRKKSGENPVQKLIDENKNPKELLIKGLKELGMDADPSKVTITLLQSGTDSTAKEFAEYYQKMWQNALGINVKVEYQEWAVFQQRERNYEYDVAGAGWSGDYNDPMTMFDMFMTGAEIVPTGWSNAKYDEIVKKAGSLGADKNEERFKLFKEAEKILIYDEAVVAPVMYRKRNTYEYKYVKNLMSPLFGAGMELKYAYTEGRGK